MTPSAKSLEEANRLLEELKSTNLPILVEGRRDEKALRRLGVVGEIQRIQESGPVVKTAENLMKKGHKAAIILTDPDNEGAKIAHLTASILEDFGLHPEMRYRKMTKLFGKTAVEQLGNVAEEGEAVQ
jgi:5S rRNA maturation endonuclease (ribonuclease M5)